MPNPYSNLANSVAEDGSTGSDSEFKQYPLRQSHIHTSKTLNHQIDDNDSYEESDDDPPQDLLISRQDYNQSKELDTDKGGDNNNEDKSKLKRENLEESLLIGNANQLKDILEEEVLKLSSSDDKNDNEQDNDAELLSDDTGDKSSTYVCESQKGDEYIDDTALSPQGLESDRLIIKNEPIIKSKIPISASITLTKIPLSTTTILSKLQNETQPNQSHTETDSQSPSTSTERITIRCNPIGSTPALHPTIFRISYSQPFSTLIKFITKKLQKLKKEGVKCVFCYVNGSFAPIPDVSCGELYRAYGIRGELVVSYCEVVAFG